MKVKELRLKLNRLDSRLDRVQEEIRGIIRDLDKGELVMKNE